MGKKDPYKNSPYDAAGMPLAAETVDYDKKDDVAEKTVHDRYVPPTPLFSDDDDYHEAEIKRKKFNPALNNTAIQFPGHRIHKKHEEDIATGLTDITDPPKEVDLEDPAEARVAVVEDSIAKGIEVPKLPDVAKQEDVDKVLDGETNTSNVTDEKRDEIKEEVHVNSDTPKEDKEEIQEEAKSDNSNPDDILSLLRATDNDGK